VIIDETYIEYCGSNESIETECERSPNLIVLKSMSKVYALSGLRVGYMVASREAVSKVAKWMPPWAVSLPAQVAAVEALGDDEYYQRRYAETHDLRQELVSALMRSVRVRAYPSSTNLVLLEVQTSAQAILEGMQRRGVFVRNCDSMGSRLGDRFLRIAAKNREQNERIAEALQAAVCDAI
jgi:histidinol-phosphate/aromatic aminotransferase/cobyric acid decarboxylase-like protein